MAITPSDDIAYFGQNRKSLDSIVNDERTSYVDRGGVTRLTWNGIVVQSESLIKTYEAKFNNEIVDFKGLGNIEINSFKTSSGKAIDSFNASATKTLNNFDASAEKSVLLFKANGDNALTSFDSRGSAALAQFGRTTLGDWRIGLTVNARNQVVLYNGNYYQWSGTLPHTISQDAPYSGWLSLGKMQDALLMKNNLADLQDLAKAQSIMQVFKFQGALAGANITALNKSEHAGVYFQYTNASSLPENGYPILKGGFLVVYVSGLGGVTQEYTTYDGLNKFVRHINSEGVASSWVSYVNTSSSNTFETFQRINSRSLHVLQLMHDASETGSKAISFWKEDVARASFNIDYPDPAEPLNPRIRILNTFLNKGLYINTDGTLAFSGNEILTVGNAGVVNGIGSDFIKQLATKATAGSTVTGSTVSTGLSGTWRVLSSEPFVFGSETKYTTLYRKIA